MARQTTKKRRPVDSIADKERSAALLNRVTTFGLIAAGLAITTFVIYAQVIGHRFIVIDDSVYIEENSMVNRGVTLAGIAWAFTTFHGENWHPITWIAHMIDSQLFGIFAGGHLLVNALIHVANTLLVFWLLLGTTRARWPSALVAALFALHPLHVESVAWASELKDTLSTFFGLLSLIAYVRYVEAPSTRHYVWVAIMLALGLMAKSMLVTWPFVMLLLDYWPLGRLEITSRKEMATNVWALVREKVPLFVLVAASAIITSIAQSHAGAVRTFTELPLALRISNALVSYAKYVLLAFWPNDLAVFYPFPEGGIPAWQVIGAAGLLIGITAFCFFQSRRDSGYLIVGWLWFLGTLVPVIGLVQVGGQAMADRYFYIPSIGLFIAIVFGLADIAKTRRVAPWLSATVSGVVLVVFATITNAQIRWWTDSVTLIEHALTVAPPSAAMESALGFALHRSGRFDEAAAHFEKALQIRPDDWISQLYMGVTRFYQGRVPEAMKYAKTAIRLQADSAKAHDLLGMALAKQNPNEAALEELRRAVELAPKDVDIRNDLGLVLAQLGRIPEAINEFHRAVRLNPNHAAAHSNLGLALLAFGKPQESIPEFEAALRLNPELKTALNGLRQAQALLSPQR